MSRRALMTSGQNALETRLTRVSACILQNGSEDPLEEDYDFNVKIIGDCKAVGEENVAVEYLAKGDAVFKRPGESSWDVGQFVVILQVRIPPYDPDALEKLIISPIPL